MFKNNAAGQTSTSLTSPNQRPMGQPNAVNAAVKLELFAVAYNDANGAPHDTLVVRTPDNQILLAPDPIEAEKWVRGLREPSKQLLAQIKRVLPAAGAETKGGAAPPAPKTIPRDTVNVLPTTSKP